MSNLSLVDAIALLLLIIGGLNWGLLALFNHDVVALLFGPMTILSKVVYTLVACAGVYVLLFFKRFAKK